MTDPELSRKLRKMYPLPQNAVEENAATTRRGLNRLLRPDSTNAKSSDGLVTDQNQAEFDQKLAVDDADELDFVASTAIFIGAELPNHDETVLKHELTQKKKMLKALRDFSGLTMVEVKSLSYPKGQLDFSRITTFVQSLQTYRSLNGDFDLVVPLAWVDSAGCIDMSELDAAQIDKKHIQLDDEARHVLALLRQCEEFEFKKKPRSTKMY